MTDVIFYRNIEKSNLKYSRFMLFQKKQSMHTFKIKSQLQKTLAGSTFWATIY